MVGEKAEARKDFQAADKRRLLEYGEGSEKYVQGKLKIGIFFYNHQAYDEAIVSCRGVLHLMKTKTKSLNLDLYLQSMEYLANSLMQVEKTDESLEIFMKCY